MKGEILFGRAGICRIGECTKGRMLFTTREPSQTELVRVSLGSPSPHPGSPLLSRTIPTVPYQGRIEQEKVRKTRRAGPVRILLSDHVDIFSFQCEPCSKSSLLSESHAISSFLMA